jgi:hypothetical protein
MDGKHIVVQKPVRSGSLFYTYKHTFAIQLLAVVNADCRFLYVDVGCQDRIGDAGVYQNSSLRRALENNNVNVPEAEPVPLLDTAFPYVFVANETFPLKTYIMKPYTKLGLNTTEKLFNYRLSRARRVVENAFGIMASRFRVFRTPILLNTSTVEVLVLVATVLHNYLRHHCAALYTPTSAIESEDPSTGALNEGEWRTDGSQQGLRDLRFFLGNAAKDAKTVRDSYAKYFENEGKVPWQLNMINV